MKKLLLALVLFGFQVPCFAAYAFVQQAENSQTFNGNLAAPSITVTASHLLVVITLDNTATAPTITDGGIGNTYTLACTSAEVGSLWLHIFYAKNANAGATVVQSASGSLEGIYVGEYSGISTSSAYISGSCVTNVQSSPGAGADILTSGNSDVTAQPALLFGFTTDTNGTSFSPTAGTTPTAFTGRTPVWEVFDPSVAPATPEDARLTSTGNVAATFGVNASGGGQYGSYITAAIAFNEGGASCTNAGYTSGGAKMVPTSGSTIVWLKGGTFGTVDCSTTQYWQPSLGVFGAN